MAGDTLDPQRVLVASGTDDPQDYIRLGISAAREQHYERGLIFLDAALRAFSKDGSKAPASALSYYGVCLALHKGRFKEAAEACQHALEREFYNLDYYANLARVWQAARSRRKAVEILDRGLSVDPKSQTLLRMRTEMGVRRRAVVPFLHRDNPLNVTLGRVRTKIAARPKKKKKQ